MKKICKKLDKDEDIFMYCTGESEALIGKVQALP